MMINDDAGALRKAQESGGGMELWEVCSADFSRQ